MKKLMLLLFSLIFIASLQANTIFVQTPVASTFCAGLAATYKFCWDGEHPSGTDYAYTNNGAGSLQGTQQNVSIDTWANHPGADPANGDTYGLEVLTGDDFLSFPVTALDLVSDDIGTLACWVMFTGHTGTNTWFDITGDADDSIKAYSYGNTAQLWGNHRNQSTGNVDVYSGADVYTDNAWIDVRVSWDVSKTTGDAIWVKVGSGSWIADADGTSMATFTNNPTILYLGDGASGAGVNDDIYLDNCRTSITFKDSSL